jgi:hypothetical protein
MRPREDRGLLPPRPPGHGFRLADGRYQTIDGPGASLTVPYHHNNRGQVVGIYR